MPAVTVDDLTTLTGSPSPASATSRARCGR